MVTVTQNIMGSKIRVATIITVTAAACLVAFLPGTIADSLSTDGDSEEDSKSEEVATSCKPLFYESDYWCVEGCPSPAVCSEIGYRNLTCYHCHPASSEEEEEEAECDGVKYIGKCNDVKAFDNPVDAVDYCKEHFYYEKKYPNGLITCYHCRFGLYCDPSVEEDSNDIS